MKQNNHKGSIKEAMEQNNHTDMIKETLWNRIITKIW